MTERDYHQQERDREAEQEYQASEAAKASAESQGEEMILCGYCKKPAIGTVTLPQPPGALSSIQVRVCDGHKNKLIIDYTPLYQE